MRCLFFILLWLVMLQLYAQNEFDWRKQSLVFSPELQVGKTMKAYYGFPRTSLQKQIVFGIGRDHAYNPQEWAYRINGPKTGFSLGLTDFGNKDALGLALTAMPIIEFQVFKSEKFTVLSGLGMSYFTEKYHPEKNLQNKAITTDLCWAFKMILNYKFYDSGNIDWRAGLGYSHHSNGHTKLMNNGFNSFLLSTSADIRTSSKVVEVEKPYFRYEKTTYEYFNFRFGLGQNVFATTFNKRKDVYSVSGEYGHVYNNTFKIGMGIYYRFYEHYYNYIQNNESLTQPGWEFEHYHNNPWHYATSLGLSINGEVLLNHVGIEVQVGYNLYKPSYKIEWRINNGWENTPQEIPEKWKLGELDSYFKWKYRISSKLGIKYYLIGLENKPQNNFYIGANLNANLGQADFTELSLGYVHSFNFKKSE